MSGVISSLQRTRSPGRACGRDCRQIRDELLLQRINDPFRIDAAARPDLIDQRVTKNRRTREVRDIRELPLLPDHGNADISEARCDQQLLDRIDLVAGERHAVELRRIGREEARRTSCAMRPNGL